MVTIDQSRCFYIYVCHAELQFISYIKEYV